MGRIRMRSIWEEYNRSIYRSLEDLHIGSGYAYWWLLLRYYSVTTALHQRYYSVTTALHKRCYCVTQALLLRYTSVTTGLLQLFSCMRGVGLRSLGGRSGVP